jgi:hypothetical protein
MNEILGSHSDYYRFGLEVLGFGAVRIFLNLVTL